MVSCVSLIKQARTFGKNEQRPLLYNHATLPVNDIVSRQPSSHHITFHNRFTKIKNLQRRFVTLSKCLSSVTVWIIDYIDL